MKSFINAMIVGLVSLLVALALVDSGHAYIAVSVAFLMGGIAAIVMEHT